MNTSLPYACACCGCLVLRELGGYEVCPVCWWEDDPTQGKDPDCRGGANTLSLHEARRCFLEHGVSELRFETNALFPMFTHPHARTLRPEQRVGIIMSEGFGGRLVRLSRECNLWYVDQSAHDELLRVVSALEVSAGPSDTLLTFFGPLSEAGPEQQLLEYVEVVILHHESLDEDQCWKHIEVWGCRLTEDLRSRFQAEGAREFFPTATGFACWR